MELDVLSTYESFEIHSAMPKIICKLQKFTIMNGFLVFYTGKDPCLPVCLASFPLDQIAVSIEELSEDMDCVNILHKTNNRIHKVYAHKN